MKNLSLRLSENFSLHEFLVSQTAERDPELSRLQSDPPEEVVENLKFLCTETLQPLRDLFGPIHVNSGYRHPLLNKRVGGSPRSQHQFGQAADCVITGVPGWIAEQVAGYWPKGERPEPATLNPNFCLWAWICERRSSYSIDQVIHEFGTFGAPAWVHIAASSPTKGRVGPAKGTMTVVGRYTNGSYIHVLGVETALHRFLL